MDGLVADGTPRLRILSGLRLRRGLDSKKHTPPAEAEPASILSLGCAFRPERRKEASRGTEAGAMAPCPGCGEFLKAYRIKLVKGSILNRVAYRTPDRQREAF